MPTYEEIKAKKDKRTALLSDAEQIMVKGDDEKRALTEDELKLIDGYIGQSDELRREIDELEQERRRQIIRDAKGTQRELEPRSTRPYQPGVVTPERIKHAQARGLKVFRGEGATERATGFAHFIFALRGSGASRNWLEKRGIELRPEAAPAEARAMSNTTDASGGFLTPQEFATEIIDIMGMVGAVRQAFRIWPMSRDVLYVPKVTTRPTWGAINENALPTEAGAQGGYVNLTAKKAGGLTKVSNELTEDSLPYVGDVLARDFAYQAAFFEDDCLINGLGTPPYLSITGIILATGTAGTVTPGAGITTPELLTMTHFLSVLGSVADYALSDINNPVWIMNRSVFARSAMRLMYAQGGNTKEDIGDGVRPSLFGYPVIFTSAMSASPAVNTAVAVFGSLETGGAFGDRRQFNVQYSPHYYFGDDAFAVRANERFAASIHDASDNSVKRSTAKLMLAAV
jgi:HK97 family phage major capsid protein